MNRKLFPLLTLTAALALAACIVPPSMFERASWGPPPEYWQGQGRYRQSEVPEEATPGAVAEPSATTPKSPADDTLEPDPSEGAGNPAPKPAPPLYAWDGGVVDGAPQGHVLPQEGNRGVETPPSGRAHIIELYQQVLDERDALSEEVEQLRRTLAQTNLALAAKTKDAEDLESRLSVLEASHKELMQDNQSIAARLVQAQIRRLEAEKLLLETKIEGERAKAEEAARAAAAQPRAGTSRTKPKLEPEGDHE